MTNRHAEFLAEHLRQPTPDEARAIEQQERDDRRAAEATRRERELRLAYLATPGADEAGWEREKSVVLATDRAEQATKNKDAARRSQSRLYRHF